MLTERFQEIVALAKRHMPDATHGDNVMDSALHLTVSEFHELLAICEAHIGMAKEVDHTAVQHSDDIGNVGTTTGVAESGAEPVSGLTVTDFHGVTVSAGTYKPPESPNGASVDAEGSKPVADYGARIEGTTHSPPDSGDESHGPGYRETYAPAPAPDLSREAEPAPTKPATAAEGGPPSAV